MLTDGEGTTATKTVSELVQVNESVPATTYVVVAVGLAVGFAMVELFNPADGFQT